MKVYILTTGSADWEGMFINNKLVDEARTLGEGNSFLYILEMSEKYGFTSKDIKICELTDRDDVLLYRDGNFPSKMTELSGWAEYIKKDK